MNVFLKVADGKDLGIKYQNRDMAMSFTAP